MADSLSRALATYYPSLFNFDYFLKDLSQFEKLTKLRSTTTNSPSNALEDNHINGLALKLGFVSIDDISKNAMRLSSSELHPKPHVINWAGSEFTVTNSSMLKLDELLLSSDSLDSLRTWKTYTPPSNMDAHLLAFWEFQKLSAKLALSQSRAMAYLDQLAEIFTLGAYSLQKKKLWTITGSIEEVIRIYEAMRSSVVPLVHSNQILNSAIESRIALFKALKQLLDSYSFALQARHLKLANQPHHDVPSLLATAARNFSDLKAGLPELESNLVILTPSLDTLRV